MAKLRRVKRAAIAAGTFAVALTIGYVMQYGDADAARVAGPSPSSARLVLPAELDTSPLQQTGLFVPKLATPVVQRDVRGVDDSLRVPQSGVKLPSLIAEAAANRPISTDTIVKVADAPTCDVSVSTTVASEAQIAAAVLSPCRAQTPFTVQHSNMVFTAATDGNGVAHVTVPALEPSATLSVTFPDGGAATATAVVPDAATVNRVIVQWDRVDTKMIQPAGIAGTRLGQLTDLGTGTGETAKFAEIFTFPASTSIADGLAGLTAHAPVTDATCGRILNGQAFTAVEGMVFDPNDFHITLPGCDQVGTFLELKKILAGPTHLRE